VQALAVFRGELQWAMGRQAQYAPGFYSSIELVSLNYIRALLAAPSKFLKILELMLSADSRQSPESREQRTAMALA